MNNYGKLLYSNNYSSKKIKSASTRSLSQLDKQVFNYFLNKIVKDSNIIIIFLFNLAKSIFKCN